VTEPLTDLLPTHEEHAIGIVLGIDAGQPCLSATAVTGASHDVTGAYAVARTLRALADAVEARHRCLQDTEGAMPCVLGAGHDGPCQSTLSGGRP